MKARLSWAVLLLPLALGGGIRGAQALPSRPLLLLFPNVPGDAADSRVLIALRTKLRADGHVDVLTFDPASPTLQRAAADAQHPEWLTDSVTADSERQDIARAIGAGYVAVVAHAGKDKADVHMLSAGPSARAWVYTTDRPDITAEGIERDLSRPTPAPAANTGAPPGPASSPPPALGTGGPAVMPPPSAPPPVTPSPVIPPPIPTPTVPISAPSLPIVGPTPSAPAAPAHDSDADLAAVQPLIAQGDQAVARGDLVDAYVAYRAAINGAPLSAVPRLKLAQAYLAGGLPDKALNEAQRALEIIPSSVPLQEFLIKFDSENGTTAGAVARFRALVAESPQDPTVHLDLGEALWDSTDYAGAETEYKAARDLAPAGSETRRIAVAHLARVYAALGRYDQCLTAMKAAGDLAYPLVLGVVQSSADAITTEMDDGHGEFNAGKITRADYYGKMKAASAKAQALADFVAQIVPPDMYAHSYLDRVQALNLLAQAAAVTVNYVETDDIGRRDKAAQLEKDAQTEMLTAHAAEQKLGLWGPDTASEQQAGGDTN